MSLVQLVPMIYLASPAVLWTGNLMLGRRRIHWLAAFGATLLITYVILVVGVQLINAALLHEMYEFDLDGDGRFSDAEMTEEAQRAMEAVSSETGRSFAPFVGVPVTFIWVSVCFVVASVIEWVGRFAYSFFNRPSRGDAMSDSPGLAMAKEETGNPYQPPLDDI